MTGTQTIAELRAENVRLRAALEEITYAPMDLTMRRLMKIQAVAAKFAALAASPAQPGETCRHGVPRTSPCVVCVPTGSNMPGHLSYRGAPIEAAEGTIIIDAATGCDPDDPDLKAMEEEFADWPSAPSPELWDAVWEAVDSWKGIYVLNTQACERHDTAIAALDRLMEVKG